jgi:predicted anti-sigma-YlaC factor YlaD
MNDLACRSVIREGVGSVGGLLLEICQLAPLVAVALLLAGCSIQGLAVNALADSLADSGDVYAADEDPELVRAALPFALKTIEGLLAQQPDHRQLLLAACNGFTGYANAFVQVDAEQLKEDDYKESERQYARALAMYLRGRDYCFRALELEWPGMVDRLATDPVSAVEVFDQHDVSLIFWTGAAWGSAIAIGMDRPDLVADFPAVRALMDRALDLEESFDHGAIHGVLITLNALPETMGGSPETARFHFERAVELSKGQSVGPYVSLAESVVVAEQDWQEFQDLLETALTIDLDAAPSIRLLNAIGQQRAQWLLDRIDLYFIDFPAED